MSGCNWVDHQGDCSSRVGRANQAMHRMYEAADKLKSLLVYTPQPMENLDLFVPIPTAEEQAMWLSIREACAKEYRRLDKLFWTRCTHAEPSA
jgi:hypothetical protein